MRHFIVPAAVYLGAAAIACIAVPIAWHSRLPEIPAAGWAPAPAIVANPAPMVAIDPAPAGDDEYLCEVYRRTPVKRDAADFTWKDYAAARRLNMDLCGYVIGGMNPRFKTALAQAGREMDARDIGWSILSGFRDDYRQSIASGFKARTGNSVHGNSRATRGYGDGRAIDITALGAIGPVLAFIDRFGARLGLTRPMKGGDPNHVQFTGNVRATPATTQEIKQAQSVDQVRRKRAHRRPKIHIANAERSHVEFFEPAIRVRAPVGYDDDPRRSRRTGRADRAQADWSQGAVSGGRARDGRAVVRRRGLAQS